MNIETEHINYDDGGWATIEKCGTDMHGWWTAYNKDGSKLFERFMQHDLKYGIGRSYYRNGQIEEEATFVNDELHGPFTLYFENGQIRNETYFEKGNQSLYDRWFNESGELRANCKFFQGKANGTQPISQVNEETNEEAHGLATFLNGELIKFEETEEFGVD